MCRLRSVYVSIDCEYYEPSVDMQALEDLLSNSGGTSPVVSELPFTKARDVSFCIFINCFIPAIIIS